VFIRARYWSLLVFRQKFDMRTIFLIGNKKKRENVEDLGVDGKILLEWILGK
jgi:hypothetical protein